MTLLRKTRTELLKLFLTNPDRFFYIQEIGRILGRESNTIPCTLNDMVSEGILISEYRANARYFKANKEYPLYRGLKTIVFKTVGVQRGIRDILEEIGNLKFIFIYGSYAKARETYLSDIDFPIIGNTGQDRLDEEF